MPLNRNRSPFRAARAVRLVALVLGAGLLFPALPCAADTIGNAGTEVHGPDVVATSPVEGRLPTLSVFPPVTDGSVVMRPKSPTAHGVALASLSDLDATVPRP
ncbi:hypothetical protein [Nonomuraea sp. NPDC050310]|uniref:hypothetical protein n=1 Tax=unclassified Nonomuraea TaxID=2593643 RepID=UPI0033E5A65E